MKQFPNYADPRNLGRCIYCGGKPETSEHVPSKVFLDIPLPENLPVVSACYQCNSGFSMDEEYLGCLIECVICGTTHPDSISRKKIAQILQRKPSLAERINISKSEGKTGIIFSIEETRVRNIIEKIARGHALYELNELLDDPTEISALPISLLTEDYRRSFESLGNNPLAAWPEVGSRAMQRLLIADEAFHAGWIVVQKGRYRYAVTQNSGIEVKMVFSEYLACEVVWE